MEDKGGKRIATDTDRISDLPQPIIHHILSFLPIDDAATNNLGLARLSKAWYHIIASCPILDFESPSSLSIEEEDIDKYVNFVTRILRSFLDYNLQMERLTIPIIFRPRVVPSLDKWIALALQHDVKELNIEIKSPRYHCYHLPRDVFEAKSIKVAKFVRCSLLQSIPHDGSSSTNLVKLCLDSVLVDELTFSSIISRCPLIEELSIIRCDSMNCVRISEVHKLKTLRIILRESSTVHIEVSSLQSLDILGDRIEILDSPKLTHLNAKTLKEAKLVQCSLLQSIPNDLSSSTNLVKLCLDSVQLNEVISSSIFSSCPLIEDLSVKYCRSINCVRISNLHKLIALQIIPCTGDLTVEIDAPCLQSLSILGSVKIDILECPMLTHLHLSIYKEFNLQHILSRLSLLRSLCLSNMFWLNKLKVSSRTLKNLAISGCYSLAELEIDAPNLNFIKYNGPFTTLVSLKHNVTSRWSVSTSLYGFRSSYMIEEFFVGLRNFVSNAKHFEYLCLTIDKEIQSFCFEELNEKAIQVQPIIPNIDLLLLVVKNVTKISYPDLFEGVLWSCHPHILCLELDRYSFDAKYNNEVAVKSICKIIASHRHCCSCTLARRWLHHLDDIRYVTEDGSEDRMDDNSTANLLSSYRDIKFIFKW